MAPEVIIPFLSAVLGGTIVSLVNYFLNARRERRRKLSDIRIQTLIDAWRKIEGASNIEDWSHRDKNALYDGLEDAIASVILLGEPAEVELAREFCRESARGAGASTLELLEGLQSSLRRELGLKALPKSFIFLRMHRDKEQ